MKSIGISSVLCKHGVLFSLATSSEGAIYAVVCFIIRVLRAVFTTGNVPLQNKSGLKIAFMGRLRIFHKLRNLEVAP